MTISLTASGFSVGGILSVALHGSQNVWARVNRLAPRVGHPPLGRLPVRLFFLQASDADHVACVADREAT